jgi:hypothetical protein
MSLYMFRTLLCPIIRSLPPLHMHIHFMNDDARNHEREVPNLFRVKMKRDIKLEECLKRVKNGVLFEIQIIAVRINITLSPVGTGGAD